MSTLVEVAEKEQLRTARSGRGFTLLRIAPAGWAARDAEVAALKALVEAHVRKTDFVLLVRGREVGVVLVDTVGVGAFCAVTRLRPVLREPADLGVRIGWASVGPGQRRTWEEAWRWAGQLLVADAAIPAAA